MAKRRRSAGKKKATSQTAEKTAAKKARRAERQRLEAEARAKAAKKVKVRQRLLAAAGVGVLVLAGFFVFSLLQPGREVEGVEKLPSLGRDHLLQGQTFNYRSATPTSGAHAPSAPGCGSLGDLPLEFAVHALEHGVVVVWYRPDLAVEEVTELITIMSEWSPTSSSHPMQRSPSRW